MEKAYCFAKAFKNMIAELEGIDDNFANKVETVNAGMTTVSNMMASMGDANATLANAVVIGEALSGNGQVTVRHENVAINVNIEVKMDAEQLARGTIRALGQENARQRSGQPFQARDPG